MLPSRTLQALAAGLALLPLALAVPSAVALPLYSTRQGLPCSACHFDPQGGGARREMGFLYERNRHDMAPEERWADILLSNKVGDALYFGTNLRQQYTYVSEVDAGDTGVSTFFPMQGALYAVFAPMANVTAQYNRDLHTTRDAWVMIHDLPGGLYVKAGQFRVPFGLRIDDHTGAMRAGFRESTSGSFGTSGFLPYDPRNVEGGLEVGATPFSSVPILFTAAITNGGEAFTQDAQALTGRATYTAGRLMTGAAGYHNYRSNTRDTDWRTSAWAGVAATPALVLLGEAGYGESVSDGDLVRLTRGFFVEADYRFSRTVLLRGKYDYIDLDKDIPGLASERYTVESDLTFLPFVDVKVSLRRVVAENASDENQGLLQWHFYY